MMRPTRRQLLASVLAGAALRRVPLAQAAPSAPPGQPRYFVQIVASGGIDTIYTFDPKTRTEVAAEVEVPYPPSAIVDTREGRLGPHLAPLADWSSRLSIVKGVAVDTANHETAIRQIVSLCRGYRPLAPSLAELLATKRTGQALGAVSLGAPLSTSYSAGWLGDPGKDDGVFAHLDAADPTELAMVAKTLREEAKTLASAAPADSQRRIAAANAEDIAALFERMPQVPRFRAESWDVRAPEPGVLDTQLQRALWLLENDLAVAVRIATPLAWDTHFDNAKRQTYFTGRLMASCTRFLAEMTRRKNGGGSLLDQTSVVLSSEIGRFPKINVALGKDHFPEIPMLLIGGAFRPGQRFGVTGTWMQASPIDLRTGRPKPGGHRLTLDDIGATVLAVHGHDPHRYGYDGARAGFLLS